MLLHNYCQKTYRFAVERFHAMWKFGVKINAVSLIKDNFLDRKSTRLNSSHMPKSRMPSSA